MKKISNAQTNKTQIIVEVVLFSIHSLKKPE